MMPFRLQVVRTLTGEHTGGRSSNADEAPRLSPEPDSAGLAADEIRSQGSSAGIVQRLSGGSATASPAGAQADEMRSLLSGTSGRPMAPEVQQEMETSFGTDFSDVRLHEGPEAPAIGAIAFTRGSDVHFAPGHYDPSSQSGRELLGHELAHVVQQREGRVQATTQAKGVALSDDTSLEAEADRMGALAARGEPIQTTPSGETQGQQSSGAQVGQRRASGEVIQRRIGFEIETGIPLTRRRQRSNGSIVWENVYASQVNITVGGAHAKLSADHIPGHDETPTERFDEWPIIEMVTDPIDDSLTVDEFKQIAQRWVNTLVDLRDVGMNDTPPPQQVAGPFYVGLPSAQEYTKWDRIGPQATVGVPLDQVPSLLRQFDPWQLGLASQQIAVEEGQRAPTVAAGIMQDVLARHEPYGGDGAGIGALKGLLTMIVHQLLVGGNARIARAGGYLKNRLASIMYKSKLSTIRNNIVNQAYPGRVLGGGGDRRWLRQQLYAATGRGGGDPVYLGSDRAAPSTATISEWIREVLNGSDDSLFDELKNEWSAEIAPDAQSEVIIELRSLPTFVPLNHQLTPSNAQNIVNYLASIYMANRLVKERIL
jgi:hypothetical protein